MVTAFSGIAGCLTRLSRWLVGLFILFCFGNRRMLNIGHNIWHCKYFWPFIMFCFSWFSDWSHSKCSVRYYSAREQNHNHHIISTDPSPLATSIINFKHFNSRSPIKIKAQLEEELHNKFYVLIKPD